MHERTFSKHIGVFSFPFQNEDEADICAKEGFSCQLCRSVDLPPHLALKQKEEMALIAAAQAAARAEASGLHMKKLMASPPHSPNEFGFTSPYQPNVSQASFYIEGVMLTERGMCSLKAQTVEKEKTRRKKRGGMNAIDADRSIFDTIESVVSGGGRP